jgi:predicted ATPase/DNA-binding XRE family transcriptional regulator
MPRFTNVKTSGPSDERHVPVSRISFCDLLKQHRLASGLTQESLADRASISAQAIGALERGERRAPYRETVALLATALELSEPQHAAFRAAAEQARARQRRPPGAAATHNLPVRLTSFVGRADEIREIAALVEKHRLVKTRIALEIASERAAQTQEEVRFVDLSPLADEAFVVGAIASILEVALDQVADPLPSLTARLKTRALLLVLDNCEHVIESAACAASALLRDCGDISIMATSRERLAIAGEAVYRLPPIQVPKKLPAAPEEAAASPALRLFIDRARAADSSLTITAEQLTTIAGICRQLEGLPLAIELAATRLPSLGFDALRKRLKEQFTAGPGARDRPRRHQTMLATITWSYDLLSDDERALLRRLAIFRGGFTLEAAEGICTDEVVAPGKIADLLSLLVDKSLLSVTFGSAYSRYAMLESVRAFAAAKLSEAGELPQLVRAHAEWLASVAERADGAYKQLPSKQWLREFGAEIDNARAALERALYGGAEEDVLLASRIVGGLRGLWMLPERRVECRTWAQAALNRIDAKRHPKIAARLMLAYIQSIDGAAVVAAVGQAIPLFERIGDRRGLISLHAHIAWECGLRGTFAAAEESIARAFDLADEERMQHTRQYMRLLQARCLMRALAGRLDEARLDAAAAARLRGATGEEDVMTDLYWEAFFAFADGRIRHAAETLETCVERARTQSKPLVGPLSELAAVRLVLGELAAAESAAIIALELAQRDQLDSAWRPLQHLAAVAALTNRPLLAARLAGFVDAWCAHKGGFRGYYERASYDILTVALRAQLSAAEIATIAAEGASLEYADAIDEALSHARTNALEPASDLTATNV